MKGRESIYSRPVVAICYDFDKTLSPGDMQEYMLFPKLGISAQEFWSESNEYANKNGMDKTLSYMKLIVKKAVEQEDKLSLTSKDFRKMGRDVALYGGLDTWFDRINEYAADLELNAEHYIISSGIKEILDGTSIVKARRFKAIYASCFVYNKNGVPIWPKQVVNSTQKTQYLFRINKNCVDLSDEDSLNRSMHDNERRVPFRNIIYIGDSSTDIPAMRVVKKEGGLAIGVYAPGQSPAKIAKLLRDERIDFFAPADYCEGSAIESYVKKRINHIKASEELADVNNHQKHLINYLGHIRSVTKYFEESLNEIEDNCALNDLRNEANKFFRKTKKEITDNYVGDCFVCNDIVLIIEEQRTEFDKIVKSRTRELARLRNDDKEAHSLFKGEQFDINCS